MNEFQEVKCSKLHFKTRQLGTSFGSNVAVLPFHRHLLRQFRTFLTVVLVFL